MTVDKATIATELNSSSMVTLSITGSGGFSGAVNLTASVVDGTGAPITGWTVALNQPAVTLAANGTGTAVATLTIPGNATALAGKIKVDAVSTLGTQSVMSDVTALKQVTINVTENAQGQCVYPPTAQTVTVKTGTKVRFLNKFTTENITIHSGGPIAHEPDPGHVVNAAYEKTPGAAGTATWYCHDHGPDLGGGNPKVIVE